MSLFDFIFGDKKKSATIAADRLKLVLAHERAATQFPYLEDMKREIIEVIKKYTDAKKVEIKTEQNQNIDLLEVEIVLGKRQKD